jgi:aspartokinase-like uncharacterized kinase
VRRRGSGERGKPKRRARGRPSSRRLAPAFDAVLKLGGSLADSPTLRLLLRALSRAARRKRLLVVPGGGPFADAVRKAWRDLRLSERAAHRMALLSMDQFGLLLCDLEPRAVPVRTLAQARAAARSGRLPVFLAARLAAAARDLPASWDVTSDSVAAWLAERAGGARLILLKSVRVRRTDGSPRSNQPMPPVPPARRLARAGIVDRAFPIFASRLPEWRVVDGRAPRSVLALLEGSRTAGVHPSP